MQYRHISEAATEALKYIDDRRHGRQQPLYTKINKLNKAIDGFSWGRIYTIAGSSGAGKSLTLEQIKREIVDTNKSEQFNILSFEFEMLAIDQVARNISGKLQKTTRELYSADKEFLDDESFKEIEKVIDEFKIYPIYYVDDVGTVSDIEKTIYRFLGEHAPNKEKGTIVTIDHLLLTKGLSDQAEKVVVDNLMHKCVELKKRLTSQGWKIMFILLSQLNRDIEKQDRVVNPAFHYPNKNDIFAASSVYYCSDIVIIVHKPAIVEGIGMVYGPPREKWGFPRGLPVLLENGRAMIYWHVIKSRFDTNQVLLMVDDFANSRVLEYSPELGKR